MSKESDIITTLKNIEHERLIAFIAEYAQSDEKLRNELYVTFAEPETDTEISGVKARISAAVRRGMHSGYIDYRGCDYICGEMDEMLAQAQKRLEQGYPVLAFCIAMQICLKGYWLASRADSSSGSLTMTINNSLETIDRACAAVMKEADGKLIYEKCCKEAKNKVFEGWNGGNYAFLRSCARFVTKLNAKKIFDSLDYLLGKSGENFRSSETDDMLTRLEICKYLEGEDEYERQIEANLHIEAVRRIAVDRALEKSDYTYAEALCREYIETTDRGYHWTRKWFDTLFDIYVKTGDSARQEELARRLLFTAYDEKYYDILKALLQERGAWGAEYPSILRQCSLNLMPEAYMRVLKKEGETRLLLDEVTKKPESVLEYGLLLAAEFPTETYTLFRAVITNQAEEATDRKKYEHVCANLRKYFEAGGVEGVFILIDEFRGAYKRRSAMLDELDKLERKLNKR